MEKKYNNKESRGLPGGPNEVFSYVTGVFSTDGYRSDSPDVNNPFNVIPSGNITMKERDGRPLRKGPLLGVDNLGNKQMMYPGMDYQFAGNEVTEYPMAQKGHSVKQRRGVRDNYDYKAWTPSGLQFPTSVSSHLMAAEYVDGRGWVAFPTLFQDSKPYADDQENWKEVSGENGWWPIYQEALKRGEVYDFGEDKEAAIAFGRGSWKDQLPEHLQDKKYGGQLPQAQVGDEIDYDDIEELIPGTNMTVSEYEALSDEERERFENNEYEGKNWEEDQGNTSHEKSRIAAEAQAEEEEKLHWETYGADPVPLWKEKGFKSNDDYVDYMSENGEYENMRLGNVIEDAAIHLRKQYIATDGDLKWLDETAQTAADWTINPIIDGVNYIAENPLQTVKDVGNTSADIIELLNPYPTERNIFGEKHWDNTEGAEHLINAVPALKPITTFGKGLRVGRIGYNKLNTAKWEIDNLIDVPKALPGSANAPKGLLPGTPVVSTPAASIHYPKSSGPIINKQIKELQKANGNKTIIDYDDMSDIEKAIMEGQTQGNIPVTKVVTNNIPKAMAPTYKKQQQLAFEEGRDIAEKWAVADPKGLKTAQEEIKKLTEEVTENWKIALEDPELAKFANMMAERAIKVIKEGTGDKLTFFKLMSKDPKHFLFQREFVRQSMIESGQQKAGLRYFEELAKRNVQNTEIAGLRKGLDDFMDPDFKKKVETIFDLSGNPIPETMGSAKYLNIKDRSKLVYMDEADPIFQNLSNADKQYLMDNHSGIGGVRTSDATITLADSPTASKFIIAEPQKLKTVEEFVARPETNIFKPETWFNKYKTPLSKSYPVYDNVDYAGAEMVEVINKNFKGPKSIKGVAAHETRHDVQKYKEWIKELQEDSAEFGYHISTDKNPIAKTYKDAMVEPTLPDKDGFTYETWLSDVGELDAELMKARTTLVSEQMKKGKSLDEAIKIIKDLERHNDDALYSWYLEEGNLNKHFKPSTPDALRKKLIQGLPVVGAFLVAGSGDEEKRDGGSIDFKIPKFKTGGVSPEAKAWMSDYKFTDADFDFLNNDESYCPNGGCLKQAQTGTEIEATEPAIPKEEAYMGDLFVSDVDLEKLNSTPDLDINQLPKELWEQETRGENRRKGKKTYKQVADEHDGKIPWSFLDKKDKHFANPYYCTLEGGCLASSYNAYDAVVGQKYPSNEFLSEAKLKKSLELQSLGEDYTFNEDTGRFEKDGKPISQAATKWIESIPYFQNTRKGKAGWDFSSDSWDTHGVMVEKGGKNIFTASDNDIANQTNKFANLSEKEKKKLYAQMTPGTVVSFTSPSDAKRGNLRKGHNAKYNLGNSSHSAQVVGYAEDGVPIIFDWGVYRRLDDDDATHIYGVMNTLSNITIPKEHIGKNLEWAKKNGYFNKEGPGELDLDLSPLYEEKNADIDELEPFYNALKTNKRSLMNDLNIKPKDYDMIAKSLIGITMEETEGGSGNIHNIENKIFGVGQDSIGLTQLQWDNIENDPKLKKVAAKYDITKKSDLKDSDKSAIASMIYGHRNLLSGRKNYKKGKDAGPSIRTYKPNDGWKSVTKQLAGSQPIYDGYTFYTEEGPTVDFFTGGNSVYNPLNSIGWDKSIENIQEQFDAIKDKDGKSVKGKYTVREVDGEYVVDKKTLGNGRRNPETGELEDLTDSEIFSYNWNSPYSLTSGDAQGGAAYVRGIQSIGELIQKKVGGEVARNQRVLEKFNSGGAKELKLYKNYFNGNVKSEKARKNYDKLNRVYYKDAKAKKMSSPNYILTHVIT